MCINPIDGKPHMLISNHCWCFSYFSGVPQLVDQPTHSAVLVQVSPLVDVCERPGDPLESAVHHGSPWPWMIWMPMVSLQTNMLHAGDNHLLGPAVWLKMTSKSSKLPIGFGVLKWYLFGCLSHCRYFRNVHASDC